MSASPGDPGWGDEGWGPASYGSQPRSSSRTGLLWALGALVVVLLVSLAGVIGYLLASGDDDPSALTPMTSTPMSAEPTAEVTSTSTSAPGTAPGAAGTSGCDPEQIASDAGIERRNVNVDRCMGDWALAHVYVPPGEPAGDTQYIVSRAGGTWNRYTGIPSSTCRQEAERDGMPGDLAALLGECREVAATGDLGLATPMTRPSCDGRGIVVLYSAVTPGAYAQEISSALASFPGASYLRTDMACPSLRQRDDNGNVIYAVYRPSGYSRQELCADVRAAGPPAYGRWLDTTSDPTALVTC